LIKARKGLDTDGGEREGRIAFHDGLSAAQNAYLEKQQAIQE
jgi:hypothetical protein